jgi:hypothetical protein
MRRAVLVLVAAVVALLGIGGARHAAWAQGTGTPSSPLQVGIKPLDPFVTRTGFDFSYPMFKAGLQVLAGPAHAQSWTSQLHSVLNASVAKYLLVRLLGTVLAGNVVWFVTRRRSEKEHGYVHGIGHGMYKAAASVWPVTSARRTRNGRSGASTRSCG